ncbi:hypothetical protein [Paenibacillus ginsengarvi]|uniref:Pectate lyase superfamily protein domain-containing protein n=1 Tax=Paenibacillus ginsengarvi TaxID=400777 RepID=A0A3B0BTI0_9BACL|nr:hypothetical protein [Paenibacillus ginsengarvi]RKN74936.1 hypothetical protein D7M11_27045 [Paenibacillus ginsengarvi]
MEWDNDNTKISRRKLLSAAGTAAVAGVLLGQGVGLASQGNGVVNDVYGNPTMSSNGNASGIRRIVEEVIEEYGHVNVKEFGAVGDGVTDDSQAFRDALAYACNNHLTLMTDLGKTYLVDNIVVEGKTDFRLVFRGILKRPDQLPATNPQTRTLQFNNCSNFVIEELHFDGNHFNNNCFVGGVYNTEFLQEYRHCLYLYNCRYARFGKIVGKNPSGDVIYINGANTYNLDFDIVEGMSVDRDGVTPIALGRNTVSVCEGKNITFNVVKSLGVGHITMPGGFDIEPNWGEQVSDVYVNYLYVLSSSMSALGITTKYGAGANIKNIEIGTVHIENDVAAPKRLLVLTGCTNVHLNRVYIKGTVESYAVHIGIAGNAQPVYKLKFDSLEIDTCRYGVMADHLDEGYMNVIVNQASENLLRLYNVSNFDFDVKGSFNPLTAYPNTPVKNFCIYLYMAGTNNLINCKFTGDLAKNRVGIVGERCITTNASNGAAQITNCEFSLNLDGWEEARKLVGQLSHTRKMDLTRSNILGTTAMRPTANLMQGFSYYDTTLNKPIWWNGANWIDGTGAVI